jgi:hypothetical protein
MAIMSVGVVNKLRGEASEKLKFRAAKGLASTAKESQDL